MRQLSLCAMRIQTVAQCVSMSESSLISASDYQAMAPSIAYSLMSNDKQCNRRDLKDNNYSCLQSHVFSHYRLTKTFSRKTVLQFVILFILCRYIYIFLWVLLICGHHYYSDILRIQKHSISSNVYKLLFFYT